MNRTSSRIMMMAAATLALTASAALAGETLTANVPFAFKVGPKTLAAGRYQVTVANVAGGARILRVQSDSADFYKLPTNNLYSVSQEPPHMTFTCDASGCNLSEVWTIGAGMRFATPRPTENARIATVRLTSNTTAGQ